VVKIPIISLRRISKHNLVPILLSHSKNDGNAGEFYKKLGFDYSGNEIGDELVMRLEL
jgi:hypothetical protein